jgi:hypothetical protein
MTPDLKSTRDVAEIVSDNDAYQGPTYGLSGV